MQRLRRLVLTLTLPALLFAGCAAGPGAVTPADDRPADAETIHRLLEATDAAAMGDQMFRGMIDSFRTSMPDVPSEVWDQFEAEFDGEQLLDMVVPIYQRHLSQWEAEALVEFWTSPAGRSFVAKQPQILQESLEMGIGWGQSISERILEKLRDEGYEPSHT